MADSSGVSTASLELYLEMENNLNDTSGNARNQSTAVGAPEFTTTTPAVGTYAHSFRRLGATGDPANGGENGGNYILTGSQGWGTATLYPGASDAWSVAFLVRHNTAGNDPGYFVTKTKGFPNTALSIGRRDRLFVVLAGHTNWYTVGTNRSTWTHIGLTWDGTTAKLYVNGSQTATPSVGGVADPAAQIAIGAAAKDLISNDVLRNSDVDMDDFRIYSRALSAYEMGVLAQHGGVGNADFIVPEDLELFLRFEDDLLDSSGNDRHQTDNLQGGTTAAYEDGKIGRAFTGDTTNFIAESGVTGYGSATLFAAAGQAWSIAAWFNVNSMSVAAESGILSRWVISPIKRDTRFVISNVGGTHKLQTQFRDGTVESWGTITPGDWHHAALTWDGSTATVYLDGVSLGNPTPGSAADQSADVLIGAEGSIGSPLSEFDGVLDDVRVYSDDLTAAEVAALAGLGPPFDVTLAFNSISGDVATIGVTFERAPQSFVLGNVTVSNGTTSNLSGSGTSYTFDVTGTAALVTISIAAAALQDAGDNNNSASNTLTFIAPSFSAGGLKQFDRTDTSETITGSILVGPIRLAPSVAGKGLVQEAYVVLGRDTNAAGTFEFVIGQDGEDSVYRAENSLATYSVTIATLQANSGLCYPRVAGSALTLRIAQTSGHLIFEEASLSVRPHGRNRLVKK